MNWYYVWDIYVVIMRMCFYMIWQDKILDRILYRGESGETLSNLIDFILQY